MSGKRKARVPMSPRNIEVWQTAYAAAFVSDFESSYNATGCDFDRAKVCTTAERAVTIADHAVAELERWRGEDDHLAGAFHPEDFK